eukprot:4159980-Amphidinium_carterae.1
MCACSCIEEVSTSQTRHRSKWRIEGDIECTKRLESATTITRPKALVLRGTKSSGFVVNACSAAASARCKLAEVSQCLAPHHHHRRRSPMHFHPQIEEAVQQEAATGRSLVKCCSSTCPLSHMGVWCIWGGRTLWLSV